jgi:hypothetical protein
MLANTTPESYGRATHEEVELYRRKLLDLIDRETLAAAGDENGFWRWGRRLLGWFGTILDVLEPTPVGDGTLDAPSGFGDLTVGEVAAIQEVVNAAGRPIEVVGSAARGERVPGSDIDYVVSPFNQGYFDGFVDRLPGFGPDHRIVPGLGNV